MIRALYLMTSLAAITLSSFSIAFALSLSLFKLGSLMKRLFLLRFLFFQSIPHLYHQIPLERIKPLKIEFQGFVYDASPALYSGLELGYFKGKCLILYLCAIFLLT